MLPSLGAGTFECGRPQIVFERGIGIVVVIEPKLCRKFRVGVPPRGGAYFDFPKVPFFVRQNFVQFTDNKKPDRMANTTVGLLSAWG